MSSGGDEILAEIKKAFKYTQAVLREDFLIYKSEEKNQTPNKKTTSPHSNKFGDSNGDPN